MNNKERWIARAAIILLCVALYFVNDYYSRKIEALNSDITQITSEYNATVAHAQALETSRDILQISFDKLSGELGATRATNDKNVKEAGTSAYKQKMSLSDIELDTAWLEYLDGVRRRNSQRN